MKLKNMIGLMLVLIMVGITFNINADSHKAADTGKYGELNKRVIVSIDKGLEWLKTQQGKDGLFEMAPGEGHPGITALAITAFLRHPQKKYSDEKHPFIQKAIDSLIAMQQENGAIYDVSKQPALPNYNTAISVMALSSTANPKKYEKVIKKAQGFLISLQIQDEESLYYGGIGYGSRESVHDLSNLNLAIQALKESGSDDDEVWNKAIKFLERTQNRSESNDQPWSGNDGGFIYSPDGESKAGSDEAGSPRSYASMTYAGLLSFIYVNVDKNDDRVQDAVQWISKHFTVEENYGMGAQGLYYNYHTMAKALRLYGKDTITDSKGVTHDWYQELAEKLIEVQQPNGSWINENSRWMEALPVLATSYAILSLDTAYSK